MDCCSVLLSITTRAAARAAKDLLVSQTGVDASGCPAAHV